MQGVKLEQGLSETVTPRAEGGQPGCGVEVHLRLERVGRPWGWEETGGYSRGGKVRQKASEK